MNTFTSNVFFRFNIENERIQNSIVVKTRIKFEIKKKKEKISNFTSEKNDNNIIGIEDFSNCT